MSSAAYPLFIAEPPPALMQRPPLVLDCTALGAVLFDEPTRDEVLAQSFGRNLHAPHLLSSEVASVALKKRRLEWPPSSLSQALCDLAVLDIKLHPVDPAAQFELALRYDLSAYDAAYLWLAAELKAPLATFDRRLAEAAQVHLGSLAGHGRGTYAPGPN
jgi:predicted nucleic acid-binding protein